MTKAIQKICVGNLLFTIAVILWGAFVRMTHSGAGCGEHWPLCGGSVFPVSPSLETLIEFTHRATSGLSFLFVVGSYFYFRKRLGGRPEVFYYGWASICMCVEVLVGAAIVLFAWVEADTSYARMWVMGLHLINSFVLVGALTLACWSSRKIRSPTLPFWPPLSLENALLTAFFLLIGVTGAITALADTVFLTPLPSSNPESSTIDLVERAAGHPLIQLRILHPFLACLFSVYLFRRTSSWKSIFRMRHDMTTIATTAQWVLALQILLGVLNIALSIPALIQLMHLGAGIVLWCSVLLLVYEESVLPKS